MVAGVLVGMLEMLNSQWKYCRDIFCKREEDGLWIRHYDWLNGRFQIHMEKSTERMEVEDQHLVRIKFRELRDIGDSKKRIWILAVQIAHGGEVDNG